VIIRGMRPNGTSEQLSRRRQKAMKLVDQGKSVQAVAVKIGVSERSVRRWQQEQKQPRKKSERAPGQPAYLSNEQVKHLAQELLGGAYAHGYSEDYWTLDRIGHVI
jgi:transposase